MAGPIIRAHDVAFPRFAAPDLDEMETFLHSFGMHTAARTDDALYMRGTDADHHVHVTELGEPGISRPRLRGDACRPRHGLPPKPGPRSNELDEPGGGFVVHLHDPDGRIVDVVADVEAVEPIAVRGHAPLNVGVRRTRIGELQRVPTGAVAGEALRACSTEDAFARHARRLVFRDARAACLGRHLPRHARRAGRSIHALRSRGPAGRSPHAARSSRPVRCGSATVRGRWRTSTISWRVTTTCLPHERQHYWGIGRHVLGGQVFDYWKDPLGFTVEHWTDSDLLTADIAGWRLWAVRSHQPMGSGTACRPRLLMDLGLSGPARGIVAASSAGLGFAVRTVAGARGRARRAQRSRPRAAP